MKSIESCGKTNHFDVILKTSVQLQHQHRDARAVSEFELDGEALASFLFFIWGNMETEDVEMEVAPSQSDALPPIAKKSSRRTSRGRRSSIKFTVDGSSPATIVAPLSDSIVQQKEISPIVQLRKKRDDLLAYIERLKAESDEWDRKLNRYSQLEQRAYRTTGGLERCRKESADQNMNITSKPRYVLTRVMRTFSEKNGALQNQKLMKDLIAERTRITEKLTEAKREQSLCLTVLKSEPRDELIAQEKWWKDLKEKEEKRLTYLHARLSRLNMRETRMKICDNRVS
ncbi:unnamed protein product [Cylicocyclus nassatus]|uniref:Uncharacterized protein n=1 Tax=Cylicocyclus nassatus TaxID=53992 RepID=A0AA36DV88_CYLNA|nr:unnamed protein product [Cylicocyclus nassatus]